MSNAVESPLPPAASSARNRSLVSSAVPKPANWRMVQSLDRYIEAYGPRVYGNSPGRSASAGPYTASSSMPDIVVCGRGSIGVLQQQSRAHRAQVSPYV